MVNGMFFLGRKFVSGLITTLKSKNPKETFSQKPIYIYIYIGFSALWHAACTTRRND